ncbi:cell division protein ZipA [Pokkaliibacter sp. MBI-7]|uniref:cell division protein ZipA n=1 Tax=Pokkaliibacter sp. MBI-7 TaxID=3040600 RepID=UPI00244C3396|nr:cell division protein ZipA [Pokkaliibacter sp. MBI-7]MDH2431228.1 cell division protein ZipA [Pokkaliibacter sp. MBI-7]
MEISLREWLIVFGMVAIVLIAVDGLRRFYMQRNRNPLRMRIDRSLSSASDVESSDSVSRELPNGGARVTRMEPHAFASALNKLRSGKLSKSSTANREITPRKLESKKVPPKVGLHDLHVEVDPLLDQPADKFTSSTQSSFSASGDHEFAESFAPTLTTVADWPDSVVEDTHHNQMSETDGLILSEDQSFSGRGKSISLASGHAEPRSSVFETTGSQAEWYEQSLVDASDPQSEQVIKNCNEDGSPDVAASNPWERPISELMDDDVDLFDEADGDDIPTSLETEQKEAIVIEEEDVPYQETARVLPMRADPLFELKRQARVKADASSFSVNAEEHIIVSVTAVSDGGFDGEQLLQVLLACGLRFGERNIFHRHELGLNKGKVQFSMANMLNPGDFDLDHIESVKTPGVTFFMGMPGADDLMLAFECMLSTAQCLAKNLNGELKDENHSVMRPQTIEHCRQRIREFERRQLTHQPHRRQHLS